MKTTIDLRPVRQAPALPLDPVEAAGLRFTRPPLYGDACSRAKYDMRQRALEESATSEFVVSCACTLTTSDGRRFVEGQAITPASVHADAARGRAALQALAERGIVVWTTLEQCALNKAKR